MSEATALTRQILEAEGAAGKYMALFCLSLFVLWMMYLDTASGRRKREAAVIGYGLLAFLTGCCPLFVRLTGVGQAGLALLLIPVFLVISYTVTLLCTAGQKAGRKWLCALCCVVLIALGGTVVPYHSPALKTKYADQNVLAVVEAVSAQKAFLEGPVVLLGQEEIMECARRYDGELELLYGKDMWMPEANTAVADVYSQDAVFLYERMKNDYLYPEEMARLAGRLGCNVLVLREKLSPGSQEYGEWVLAAQIPGYVVYRISK